MHGMRSPLFRAWQEIIGSFGVTWRTVARFILGSGAAVGLIYLVLGEGSAMSEAWVILLSLLAAAGACFLPTFLWNLWLAPYNILAEQNKHINERIDNIDNAQMPAKAEDKETTQPARLNSEMRRKRNDALRDIKTIKIAIEFSAERSTIHREFQGLPTQLDHDYAVLTKKYSAWFPDSLDHRQMQFWIQRILSVLEAHNYEDADSLIAGAVSRGSWRD